MPDISRHAMEVLALLRDRHNVLVSGPPGTGKSRLLSEVAAAFEGAAPTGPVHVAGAAVAIPRTPPITPELSFVLPGPSTPNRKVFRTVFHQNSKYRDFVTGLMPAVGSAATGGGTTFRVVSGTLHRAAEYAKSNSGASLLVIEEINRGPAVQVFGGSIAAIESDKRLATDGTYRTETQRFEITSPDTGELVEYALPYHLYILAAMNQADTSVEPLDVAFLRRWVPFRLEPSEEVLRRHFRLLPVPGTAPPATPTSAQDIYEAATRAWSSINARIRIGRGPEFQIGHGVLMARGVQAQDIESALRDVAESWTLMRAHIDEVFFGDMRGVAAVLNVGAVEPHPYTLEDLTFADEPRLELRGPNTIMSSEVYALLRAVAG